VCIRASHHNERSTQNWSAQEQNDVRIITIN
jgi:hypothetical protein